MWLEIQLHIHQDWCLWAVPVLNFISVYSHRGLAGATQRLAHCPRLQKKCDVVVTCVSGMLLPLFTVNGSLALGRPSFLTPDNCLSALKGIAGDTPCLFASFPASPTPARPLRAASAPWMA